MGSAFFTDGIKTHVPAVHEEVLLANGFDPTLVERAIADPATIDDVRADHDFAAAEYGAHGVPTIVLEIGVRRVRPGGRARTDRRRRLALWELLRSMARFPHLYELRHPKTHDDLVHVAQSFRDLPHDPRLEHGREPRAVDYAAHSAAGLRRPRRPAAAAPSTPATLEPPPSRAAARTDAEGTTTAPSLVTNAIASAAGATATTAPRALSIFAAFRPEPPRACTGNSSTGGALGVARARSRARRSPRARPRNRRSRGRRP